MNVRKLLESIPQIQRAYETESDSGCSLRARKKHDRHDGSAVMVFKVTGAGRKKRPCGMLNCPPCGALWRMFLDDLESKVPDFVSDQPSASNARKAMCASSAASTTGSTISTLTELTEVSEISRELLGRDMESGLLTPASTSSSVTLDYSPAEKLTPTKISKSEHKSYGVPSPASSVTLVDFNEDSVSLMDDHAHDSSSISTLTDLTEHSHGSSAGTRSAPSVAASSSAISTLTDFSEVQSSSSLSAPPSSLSSIPPTLSTATTITTPTYKRVKVQKRRRMIEMSDGSSWIPPTLERVQAYITSQGERRLPRSVRGVVAFHAWRGSRVGLKYESAIMKVDRKVGKKSETREELLAFREKLLVHEDDDEDMEG
ncbi:hypothetical protein KCU91_g2916, partial [Aureobasidium melanogenum]